MPGSPAAPGSAISSSAEGRLQRDSSRVLALVLVILVAALSYAVVIVTGFRSIRTRTALERNEIVARLAARLMDEQTESALSVLQTLARQPDVAKRLREGRQASLLPYLTDAVDLIPDLRLAAIYDTQGRLQTAYPPGAAPLPLVAHDTSWWRNVSTMRRPLISGMTTLPASSERGLSQVIIMAVPIGTTEDASEVGSTIAAPARKPGVVGFLLAYYRLGDIYSWLRQVNLSGGSVLIVDPAGHLIASSRGQRLGQDRGEAIAPTPALMRVCGGPFGGHLATPAETGQGASVVGYAHAERTGWTVLVVQPTEIAFAPSELLIRRLGILTLLLLVLLAVTSWLLVGLYHRQQQLTRDLADRNKRLLRADQAKTNLLANVSHDLKTPIASMQLAVSGLLEADTDFTAQGAASKEGHPIGTCLFLVSRELDDLSRRVRNLLDMTRLEASDTPAVREPCDLSDIVASALERMRFLLGVRPVYAAFPPLPLLVDCDYAQIETVVINLLENAHKFSPPGTPIHLAGGLEGQGADAVVTLRIRDEGLGIPLADQEKIFEKFYRARNPQAAGGTGLGLAICRTIVTAHGGHIHYSAPSLKGGLSGGAEFVVSLPPAENASAQDLPLLTPQPASSDAVS